MQHDNGKRFEEEVARLYEALGFVVKRDRLISGQQVDIVAERYLPGIGLTKLLIECKFVAQGSVSNQNVQDFVSMFNAIGPQNGFSNGVLVTNGSFSRNARASKISGAVHLRTTAELETEAINLSDAAYAYVTEYESADLFSYYINLGAEGALPARKPRPSTPSRPRSPDPSKDVEKAILHWIRHDRSGFLTVLADFGAGKTSLLEYLKYELCKDILTKTTNAPPIPIFFPLRDLAKFLRLDDYVLNVLAREFRQPVPITIFWKFLEAGSLVLLLDGFDEIAAFANKDDRREAFHIISPLIARNTGPSLMTCRPSFFVSAAEYQDLLNDLLSEERKVLVTTTKSSDSSRRDIQDKLESIKHHLFQTYVRDLKRHHIDRPTGTLTLKTFDDDRVCAYLKLHSNQFAETIHKDWASVHRFLHRVYDLSDLMKRPFLLEMIVKTILTGKIDMDDDSINIGTSGLYEIYTSTQLARESENKNRTLFSAGERQILAQALAIRMLQVRYGGISYAELIETIVQNPVRFENLAAKIQQAGEEAVATDVGVCSFLSRKDDDRFHFVHKSFMEFFLARHIKLGLEAGQSDPLLNCRLPREVLYFLGSFVGLDEKLLDNLVDIYEKTDNQSQEGRSRKRNILGALSFTVGELRNLFLQNGCLDQIAIDSAKWRGIRTRDIVFDTVKWNRFAFAECVSEATSLRYSQIGQLEVLDSALDLSLSHVELSVASFRGQNSISLTGEKVNIRRLDMADGSLSLDGELAIEVAEMKRASIVFRKGASATHFARATFEQCQIESLCFPDRDPLDDPRVKLVDCDVFGANGAPFINTSSRSGKIILDIDPRLAGCRGVLIVDESDKAINIALQGYTWRDKICLVDFVAYLLEPRFADRLHDSIVEHAKSQREWWKQPSAPSDKNSNRQQLIDR